MALLRHLAAALLLSLACAAAQAQMPFEAPPAIIVYPDDYPVAVAFFFPSGTPLERFTSRPGAWYAVYRLPMYPGRPYELLLAHDGDPARMKVYALDDHPFGKVNVKFELPLRKFEAVTTNGSRPVYASMLSIPRDAAVSGLYLLLEWDPPAGQPKPIPVALQALSVMDGFRPATGWWVTPKKELQSPLQSQQRQPYEVPVPRRGGMETLRPWGY